MSQTCKFQAWFNDSGAAGEHAHGLFFGDATNSVGLAPSTQKDGVDE
jgi:hypothetical protein